MQFIWAPSSAHEYPYSFTPPPIANGSADFIALDTNKDGKIDTLDDGYSPYYPGDAYVDWVGLSVYSYGILYPWLDNYVAEPGKFEAYFGSFYQSYGKGKNKPVMIAEGSACYHLDSPHGIGVGQLITQQSW